MEAGRLPSLKKSSLTLFGLGYLPAGATLASLVGLGVWRVLLYAGSSRAVLVVVFAAVLGVAMAELAVRRVGGDPRQVVVDEFLGMYAALLFLPSADHLAALALFIAFRALDILKVPPFSWIERWKSPSAILMDDIAIGLALGLAYRGISAWLHP